MGRPEGLPIEMGPRQFLESLCRRHGLPARQAEPLLPLVQLAWTARPVVRRRILEMVEQALERDSPPESAPAGPSDGEQQDRRLLELVARVLHRWKLGAA